MALLIAMIFPMISCIYVATLDDDKKVFRNYVVLGIALVDFLLILSAVPGVLAGKFSYIVLADVTFFKITIHADILSILMGILMTFLWILTTLYAIGYMEPEHAKPRFFASLTFCLGATMSIIFAGDLVSLFIAYELLTMGVYPLVIHEETEEALRSGVMYLTYLLVAGAFLLFAIILTYNFTGGEVRLTPGGMSGLASQSNFALYVLFFFYLLGFGAKSAIMPLHIWLPRAMVAPTPVSAVLHAVAVVNVGLYGIIRMIYNVFGAELFSRLSLDVVLGILASITILLSAIYALRVKGLKHMLAYSTVNQLSYVILGVSSLHPVALLGGLIHIVYHSFMKITLFYSAGTIITQSGKTKVHELHGMARRMPICFAAFLIGTIGILGLPPVAGWVSKWYMIEGYFTIARPAFAFVFIISTLIELGFFVPPLAYAYFGKVKEEEKHNPHGYITGGWEAPVSMLVPLVVVAVISTVFGLYGSIPFELGKMTVKELLGTAAF